MDLQKRAERFINDLPGYEEKHQTLIINIFKAHIMDAMGMCECQEGNRYCMCCPEHKNNWRANIP